MTGDETPQGKKSCRNERWELRRVICGGRLARGGGGVNINIIMVKIMIIMVMVNIIVIKWPNKMWELHQVIYSRQAAKGSRVGKLLAVIYQNQKKINGWPEIIFQIGWYLQMEERRGSKNVFMNEKKTTRCSLKLNRFSTELPFSTKNLELRFHQSIFRGWKT